MAGADEALNSAPLGKLVMHVCGTSKPPGIRMRTPSATWESNICVCAQHRLGRERDKEEQTKP